MKIHIVKEGDTLYKLSQKYGVDLEKLISANPQLEDPDELSVGTKIKIPSQPKALITKKILGHKEEKTKAEVKKEENLKEMVKEEVKKENVKEKVKEETKEKVKEKLKDTVQEKIKEKIKKKETKEEAEEEVKDKIEDLKKEKIKVELKVKEDIKAKPEMKSEVKPESKSEVKQEAKKEIKQEVKPEAKPQAKDLFKQFSIPSLEVSSFYDLPKIPDLDDDSDAVHSAKSENLQPIKKDSEKKSENIAFNMQSYPELDTGPIGVNQTAYPQLGQDIKPEKASPAPNVHGKTYPNAAGSNMMVPGGNWPAGPNMMTPSGNWPAGPNMMAPSGNWPGGPNMMAPGGNWPPSSNMMMAAGPNMPVAGIPNLPFNAAPYAIPPNTIYPYAPFDQNMGNAWGMPEMRGHSAYPAPNVTAWNTPVSPCGCQERSPVPWYSLDQARIADARVETEAANRFHATTSQEQTLAKDEGKEKEAKAKITSSTKKTANKAKSVAKKMRTPEKKESEATVRKSNNPWLNT